jgi:hypothetical protein
MAKRHRRLRIHYTVGNDLGLWWCRQIRKWVTLDQKPEGLGMSNTRKFRTKRRAFGHAGFMGEGFYVVQFNPHCGWRRKLGQGTWLTQEWYVTKEKV